MLFISFLFLFFSFFSGKCEYWVKSNRITSSNAYEDREIKMRLPFLCTASLSSRIAFSLSFASSHPDWPHELATSASVSHPLSLRYPFDSWNETMWQEKSQAANWHWLAQRQLAYGLTIMHYIRVRMQSKCTCIVHSRFKRIPLETAEQANRFSLPLSLVGGWEGRFSRSWILIRSHQFS